MYIVNLYYKRVDPYLCSELAPVLEGSGSAAAAHGKVRASTVFLSYSLHASIVGFFTTPKTDSWWGCVR